jgi:hypothetical protein
MWLDSEGRIEWITAEDPADHTGLDRSYREYFTETKSTLRPYFSDVIISSDETPRLYVAYPAIDRRGGTDEFKGVVVVTIGLDKLGNLLKQDSTPDSQRNDTLCKRSVADREEHLRRQGKHSFGWIDGQAPP